MSLWMEELNSTYQAVLLKSSPKAPESDQSFNATTNLQITP